MAQAARAHATVKPYTGEARARVTPIPNSVATTVEAWPTPTTVVSATESSLAMLPFKLTKVAAVVQPKCTVKGKNSQLDVDNDAVTA